MQSNSERAITLSLPKSYQLSHWGYNLFLYLATNESRRANYHKCLPENDLPPELAEAPEPVATGAAGPVELIGQPMDAYEKYAIQQTLTLTNGNREEAARILGIGARTLYRKLEKYDLS